VAPLGMAALVSNGIHHLMLSQRKKVPLKKPDLVKTMNNQSKDFKEAIKELGIQLESVFGFELVGVKLEDAEWRVQPALETATHFFLVSKFGKGVTDWRAEDDPPTKEELQKDNAIRMVLNVMYLLRNRDVDEGYLWQVLEDLDVNGVSNRKDFSKFLKTEMVDTMYLSRTESRLQDEMTYRYSWGPRAEKECDKYEMLQHVAMTHEKPMASFKSHFEDLQKDERYKDRVIATMEHCTATLTYVFLEREDAETTRRNADDTGMAAAAGADAEEEDFEDILEGSQTQQQQTSSSMYDTANMSQETGSDSD